MFDTIRKLGSYVIESKRPADESILIQESKLLDTKKVICIFFELKDDSIIYDNTHLEEYDSSKSGKLLRQPLQEPSVTLDSFSDDS